MRRLFDALARWIIHHFIWFVVIVVLLLSAGWLRSEFQNLQAATSGGATLRDVQNEVEAHRHAVEADLIRRVEIIETASLDRLDARIGEVGKRIAAISAEQQASGFNIASLSTSPIRERATAHYKRAVELALLSQERDYLIRLRTIAATRLDSEAAAARLAELRQTHVEVHAALTKNVEEQERLTTENPATAWLLGFPEYAKHVALRRAHRALLEQNRQAYDAYLQQKKIAERITVPDEPIRFDIRRDEVEAVLRPVREAAVDYETRLSTNWVARAAGPVAKVAPVAAWIILGIVLLPIVVKLLFYFVLAPLASRRPPVRLLPNVSGAVGGFGGTAEMPGNRAKVSSVSQAISIDEGDEMLVNATYIQSAFIGGKKDTKWLMDWSLPLSSLAAGLVAMTRMRADGQGTVVVSATSDPLMEVAVISLPAGSAIVLQPRSLVGVIYRKGKPLRITRHWRLGSLHAWLTLQLRYLVLHGEARLIIRGCRGVRLETAGAGRSINQAATIGFTANSAYKTIRTETFWPYLSGKQELFNDCFAGESAWYLYEETPYGGKKPGIAGRGLEGLMDSVLKAFGI